MLPVVWVRGAGIPGTLCCSTIFFSLWQCDTFCWCCGRNCEVDDENVETHQHCCTTWKQLILTLSLGGSVCAHLASLLCWPSTGVRLIVAMWWCWGSGWWLKIMLVWRWSLGYGDKDTAELPSKWKEQTFETQNQKLCIDNQFWSPEWCCKMSVPLTLECF